VVVLRQPPLYVGSFDARIAVHGDVKRRGLGFPFEVQGFLDGLAAGYPQQSAKKSGQGRFS
jgi:hypothetical protein